VMSRGDVEALHRGVVDFDALLIAARVERAFDLEPGVGGGCADHIVPVFGVTG